MRCLTCGYSLSNLHSRTCPECGTGFKPTDMQFAPGKVAFCCPHCDQDYYGTTADGHLYPIEFDCARCGVHIHMDETVMRPAEGYEAEDTEPHKIPWTQRSELGWFKAFRKTLVMAVMRPSEIGLGRAQRGDTRDALRFAAYSILLVAILSIVAQSMLQAIFFGFITAVTATGPGAPGAGPTMGMPFFLSIVTSQTLGALIALPFGLLVLWLWAMSAHGILKLTGQPYQPAFATKRAFYYASGANVMSLVPCLGWLVGGPWTMVCTIKALKATQRISVGRAVLAVLPMPIAALGLGVGFIIWIFSTTLATMTGPGAFGMFNPDTETLTTNYVNWANRNKRYPQHVVELVMDNTVFLGELIQTNSATAYYDLVVGNFDTSVTDDLPEPQRTQTFQAYLNALPKDILAYRLGDFVFYPSARPPDQTAPTRWLIVAWPDPDTNGLLGPSEIVEIGLADGTTFYSVNSGFPAAVAAENSARELAGLPPIPHPMNVKHQQFVMVGDEIEVVESSNDEVDENTEPTTMELNEFGAFDM